MKIGDRWTGPAYRVGEWSAPRDASAADVVRYETEELGNDLGVTEETLRALESIPASRLIWLTATLDDADRYRRFGEQVWEFYPKGTVIGTDGPDGGYLLLLEED